MDPESDFKEPGRVEGCCLVLAAVGIFIIMGGINLTVGILVVEWVDYFDVGYRIVAWLGTTNYSTSQMLAPVGGLMIKRFGLRRCLFISAVVNSFAVCCSAFSKSLWLIYILWIITGMAYTFHIGPILSYIMIRFRRYRSTANAFVVSAASLGTIIFGVIINESIEAYTWRGAVLIIGAIALNMAPCSLILRDWNKPRSNKDVLLPRKDEQDKEDDNVRVKFPGCKNILNIEILKQPNFIGVTISVFFLNIAVSVIFVHIVSGFRDLCKLELEDARYLVPYWGASGLIGRFVVCMISQHPRFDTFTLCLAVNILLGVTVALVPLFKGFTAAVILVILIGVGMSGFAGLTHLVIAEIIEEKYIHMSVQYMLFPAGIAFMIGAPLAGWVYDVTGNYVYSFELTASLVGVSVLIMSPFWLKHIRQLNNRNTSNLPGNLSATNREWIASLTSLA
ncbi:monocarboxylate transporter 13-like [Tubulanus polymorphus]|uniref:monocarboxylate transporter 13-like n=1 Tax=Tubulanus polymorphus TaxID=672921 RepID=UPI003DA4730A